MHLKSLGFVDDRHQEDIADVLFAGCMEGLVDTVQAKLNGLDKLLGKALRRAHERFSLEEQSFQENCFVRIGFLHLHLERVRFEARELYAWL